ncbi:MAG: hypothetical protein RIS70_1188 [Planctomycetota bacterium]
MTSAISPLVYHRLRAPREHGQALFDPPRTAAAALFDANRKRRLSPSQAIADQSLASLSNVAQRELLDLALRYTVEYRDHELGSLPTQTTRLVLTGHQPELYHPGVWLKNFVAASVARELSAIAINLIIDSDSLRSPTLAVPGGTADSPIVSQLAYDRPIAEIPQEERQIEDPSLWSSFAERVGSQLREFVPSPLIEAIWPTAIAAAKETQNIGRSFCRARHLLEQRWGICTIEVPLSQAVETPTFAKFAWSILSDPERFQAAHNASLAAYRLVHKIRGIRHPVPDLVREAEWFETPFWVWHASDPRRRKLFVSRQAERIVFSDRSANRPFLEIPEHLDTERVADRLGASRTQGWKIRPRALITTLYARLLLGDLFIHGIGGAKYDQVTDLIMRQFYQVEPPAYLTATATCRLPIVHPVVTSEALQSIERELRDLRFVPERFLAQRSDLPADAVQAIEAKRAWLARNVDPKDRAVRYQAIKHAVEMLQPLVDDQRVKLLEHFAHQKRLAANHHLLSSREYSFALFPENFLRGLLLELSVIAP